MERPWQGRVEELPEESHPHYDPTCYLCPTNARAENRKNPNYTHTFVFDNDFSALFPETPEEELERQNLLIAKSERGICRVVCFSPRHDLTLAEMKVEDIRRIIDVWVDEYTTLGGKPFIRHVQIFENKGEMMGCSNPHPHGQIWAQSTIPVEPSKEMVRLKEYYEAHNSSLLADYLELEVRMGERIVLENVDFVVLVPFWAVWPFETMIVSRRHIGNLAQMSEREKDSLADALRRVTTRYDNLFQISFPYSSGMHQSPTDGEDHSEWHFHVHFYPPLLRSATVRKFMVGYEMLGEPQRDITPEWSAEQLRGLPDVHYKEKQIVAR
jgi:UDPglucose--hexose-1-phosphate uridylyltransferase